MSPSLRPWIVAFAAVGIAAGAASGEPLDLADPTPRWIDARFEISARMDPGRLDAVWSPSLPAWFQHTGRSGWAVVAVPAESVERLFALAGERPVPGSFTPFVWILDVETGHVLAAELSGVLSSQVRLGFLRMDVEGEVHARLGTERAAGFREAHQFLGQRLHRVCGPSDEAGDCTLVQPVPFRPDSGYVNAVGALEARGAGISAHTFCSLGEARFTEHVPGPTPSVAAAPPP